MPTPSFSNAVIKKALALSFCLCFGFLAAVKVSAQDFGDLDICSIYPPACDPTIPVAPSRPSTLSVPFSDTDGAFSVSWGASSGTVTNYTLQRLAQGGSWITIQDGNATSRSESGLADSAYSYRVRACNTSSCSIWSATKTVQVARVYGAPGEITFSNLSHPSDKRDVDGNYTINWGAANNNPTRYELYLTAPTDPLAAPIWARIYNGPATSFSVSQSDSIFGYGYKVRACNASGCGPYSSEDIFAPYIQVISPPSVPASISAPSSDPDGAFNISWSASTGMVSKYTLERRTNGGAWTTLQDSNGTSRSESGLADGGYEYRVRGCNFVSCSGWRTSSLVSVAKPPGSPANLRFADITYTHGVDNDGSYTVLWNAPSEAVSRYELSENGQIVYSGVANSVGITAENGNYDYSVRACFYGACSASSSTISINVAKAYDAPNLNVTKGSSYGEVTANWNAPSGSFSRFELQRKYEDGTWQTTETKNLTNHELGLYAGDYSYRVRVCSFNGCSSWSNIKTINIETNSVSEETALIPVPLSFEQSVDRSGSLRLSMPFKLLSGVNGLVPELSLVNKSARYPSYNTNNPSPIVGAWSLQGLSPISTCGLPDHNRTGKELLFCYMGQDLVPVIKGQQGEGSFFRLRKNSDVLFRIYRNSAGFLVFSMQKGDRKYIFGNSNDSRLKLIDVYPYGEEYELSGDGRDKVMWYPSSIEDSFGNAVSISYQKDTDLNIQTLYPVLFEYDNYRVELAYTVRPGAENIESRLLVRSEGGVRKTMTRQLRSVRNLANGVPTSVYELEYGLNNETSILESVRYCGYDQSGAHKICGQPTTFNYVDFDHVLLVVNGTLQSVPTSIPSPWFAVSEIHDGLGNITKFTYEDEELRRAREEAQGYTDFGDEPQLPSLNPNCVLDNICPGGGAMQIILEERSNGTGGFNRTEYAYPYTYSVINLNYRKKLPDGTFEYHDFSRANEQDGLPNKKSRYLNPIQNVDSILLSKEERRWEALGNSVPSSEAAQSAFYKTYQNQKTNYIVENGVLAGAIVTKNEPVWTNNVISSMKSTVYTGYGYQEDGYPGTVDPFTDLQHKQVTTTAYHNNLADWSIGFATSEVVHYIDPKSASNNQEEVVGFRRAKPDSLKSDRTNKNTNIPYFRSLTTTTQFDAHGNPLSSTISGTDIVSRKTEAIDFIDNRYPRYQINAEGHLTEIEYDLRFGLPKRKVDPNGLETTYEYDAFGNLIRTTQPNGTLTEITTSLCDFSCPEVEGVEASYKTTTTVSNPYELYKGAPDTTTYFDVLGREIRVETEGFAGEILKVDIAYDNLGRVVKRSIPYVLGAPTFTTYEYDLYDRPITIENADGSRIDYIYEQLTDRRRVTKTTTIAGPLGGKSYTRVEEYNSLNQLIVSYDAYGTADQVKTDYRYDAQGNSIWTRVNNDNTTIVTSVFDNSGNMTRLVDPSAGTINYEYDGLKQIVRQTDARNIVTTFAYDRLGRLRQRVDDHLGTNQVINQWTYDGQYLGALNSKSRPGFVESYTYDSLMQLDETTTAINLPNYAATHASTITYDYYGRVRTQNYPSGLVVFNQYNNYGFASEVRRNSAGGPLIYRIDAMDNHGNISDTSWGNGLSSERRVNPITGQIEKITTGGGSIQNLEYDWWTDGTLYQRRQLGANSSTETFSYDHLKRLRSSNANGIGGARTMGYTYDPLGNLESKTDSAGTNLTNYNYASDNKPYRLNTVSVSGTTHTMSYDASGNVTFDNASGTANDRIIRYNAFGKPYLITKGTEANPFAQARFEYGPDTARFYQENHRGDKTIYLYGGGFEIVLPATGNTARIEKTYLSGAMHFRDVTILGSTSERMEYTHTDHLGSINAVTDQSGALVHAKAFDPFGSYRDIGWTSLVQPPSWADQARHTSRGFTGHEQLDEVGLIHMNGRVYDARLGRFISPDVIVQAPNFSQSYNRYSYVWNNPVSMIDPTGFIGSYISGSAFDSNASFGGGGSVKSDSGSTDPGKTRIITADNGTFIEKQDADGNITSVTPVAADDVAAMGYTPGSITGTVTVEAGAGSDVAGFDGGSGGFARNGCGGVVPYACGNIDNQKTETNNSQFDDYVSAGFLGGTAATTLMNCVGPSVCQWNWAKVYTASEISHIKGNLAPSLFVGRSMVFLGAGLELNQLNNARLSNDKFGMADSSLDLGMLAPSALGGPVGFGLGLFYTGMDATGGFNVVSRPVTDILCWSTGDC